MSELDALERRRAELRARVSTRETANQARRMVLALNARHAETRVIIGLLVVAFAIGAALGAIYMPTTHVYLVMCR